MNVKRTPIASAVALALAGAGAILPAYAQQAPAAPAPAASAAAPAAAPASAPAAKTAQQLDSVTITGIRASLEQSLNVKRNADSRVDVVLSLIHISEPTRPY